MFFTWDRLIGVKIDEKFFCSMDPNEVYEFLTSIEIRGFDVQKVDKDQLWMRFTSPFRLEAYPDIIGVKVFPKEEGSILHFKVRKGHLLGIFNHMKKNYGIVLSKIKETLELEKIK